jgi:hypothetical protein
MAWWSRTWRARSTSDARSSSRPASAASRASRCAAERGGVLVLGVAALAFLAPGGVAAAGGESDLAALRERLASPWREQRAAALEELGKLGEGESGRRLAWLDDGDPVVRRAAARLLAAHPEAVDAAAAVSLRAAFLREKDPAVAEALVAALVASPKCVAPLAAAVEAAHDPRLAAAYARVARAVACDAIAAKARDGGVPGFYDGQFRDLWELLPSMPEELLAIAHDDSLHLVMRTLAVMALHETRRPTLERDLADLIKPEQEELRMTEILFFDRHRSALEILQDREFFLSKYARFSLAKAGQTDKLRALIHEIDSYLAIPRNRQDIAFRGDREEGPGYWRAEFLRDLAFDVGYYFQQFDDYASAEQRYRDLLQRFPESRFCENAHYNLACICAIQGRKREALDHLREAIRCGFGNAAWLLEDGDLTSLRDDAEFQSLVLQARSGQVDDAGRDWIRKLQRFLPAGTKSFFDLSPDRQREVIQRAGADLSPAQWRRLLEDAPPDQREALGKLQPAR